jgi:hypothetical protein
MDREFVLPPELKKLPNESALWYSRFCAYALMPADRRTLKGVYRKLTDENAKIAPQWWFKASQRFRWRERAARLDEIQFAAKVYQTA